MLIDAGTVLTSDGLVHDQTILVEDGLIAGIGSGAEFAHLEGDRLGGDSMLLVPGFINAHQHGNPYGWAALGCADGPLEPWMIEIMKAPTTGAYTAARVVAAQQLRAGTTTTVHHQTSYAATPEEYDQNIRASLEGYRDAGLRVVFAAEFKDRNGLIHFEDEFLSILPDGLAKRAGQLLPRLPAPEILLDVLLGIRHDIARGQYGQASLMLGPAGPVWCSDDLFRFVAKAACDEGFGVTSHVLESPHEKTFGPRAYDGRETVAALSDLGIVNDGFVISHGCQLNRTDAEILAAKGASVASNPGSNLRLHNGVAPVRMLLEAGVNVAIGTDSMSLGDRDELLDELRLMEALQRTTGVAHDGLDPSTLVHILTANGATALRRQDIGVIEAGASADLVLVDLDRLTPSGTTPDPLAVFVAAAHPEDFDAVISQGVVSVRHGEIVVGPPDTPFTPRPAEFTEVLAELSPYARNYYGAMPLPQ